MVKGEQSHQQFAVFPVRDRKNGLPLTHVSQFDGLAEAIEASLDEGKALYGVENVRRQSGFDIAQHRLHLILWRKGPERQGDRYGEEMQCMVEVAIPRRMAIVRELPGFLQGTIWDGWLLSEEIGEVADRQPSTSVAERPDTGLGVEGHALGPRPEAQQSAQVGGLDALKSSECSRASIEGHFAPGREMWVHPCLVQGEQDGGRYRSDEALQCQT